MPNFRKLSDSEVRDLTRRHNNIDELGEYLTYLQALKAGDWGSIELSEGEQQRTVKRRTSIAATAQGKKIRWRPGRAAGNSLVFRVLPPERASKAPDASRP